MRTKDADKIRNYVVGRIIGPARRRGEDVVTVTAKEIHEAVTPKKNNYPNICQAMTNSVLANRSGVKVKRDTPNDGPNVTFYINLKPDEFTLVLADEIGPDGPDSWDYYEDLV